ncbi:alpha/beta fold hydrolase [Ningiella sp. W23]|uniref:alpha/beta fold hydrolase n=1 Tax=Ningiella sp. W23 TaxID=3023715 RepID=UPI003757779C
MLSKFTNFACVAIDLAGHGKSMHRSDDAHYHLTDYVYDIHQLLLEQKWTKVNLIGHSLGGIICSIYAASFPEHVNKLICIETCGPLCEKENTTVAQLKASMQSRERAKGDIKHPDSLQSLVSARTRISDLSEQNAALILERNLRLADNRLKWRTDKRLRTKSAIRLTHAQAMNVIENILCPTYVILGNSGFEKVKLLCEQRAGKFKNVSISEFKGGHHVHMEAVDEIADYIQALVSID